MSQQLASERLRDELLTHRIGYGLVCIASPDNNDLGRGPTFVRQTMNPRPIDQAIIKKIKSDHIANGLKNREVKYAVQVTVKRSLIAGGVVNEIKDGDYTNFVKWTDNAPGQKCQVANGNHRITFMEDKYALEMFKLKVAQGPGTSKDTPRMLAERANDITTLKEILQREAIWLVELYDEGRHPLISIHVC